MQHGLAFFQTVEAERERENATQRVALPMKTQNEYGVLCYLRFDII